MTFFKVNDPKNRELIKEVIAKRAVIREADRRRKMGDAFELEQLSRFFKPITQQTEKIEKGVRGLPGEIAKVLPRPVNIIQGDPPAYEGLFAGEDEILEGKNKVSEKENLPNEVKKIDGGYKIGNEVFKIDHETKTIETSNQTINSDKIYDILTNKNTIITWYDLDEEDKDVLGDFIFQSNIFYQNNNDVTGIFKRVGNNRRWNNIFSYIWVNRFEYMDDEQLEREKTKEDMKKIKKTLTKKTPSIQEQKQINKLSPTTIKLIEKQTGSGLKKDYVTLPSDSSELVDRLTLLAGSKDAGNTGV